MRRMGKLTQAELEADVAKAARLAVASVEDRSAVIAELREAGKLAKGTRAGERAPGGFLNNPPATFRRVAEKPA